VTIYDSAGTVVATLRAGYVSSKWTASWIVTAGSLSGTYNATIDAYSATVGAEKGFADSADAAVLANCNTGPTVKKFANFDVSRVSMTDLLAAANAAEAEAILAGAKATQASTDAKAAGVDAKAATAAATQASTDAKAATTAATVAGTKADAAKTAADGAKAAADNAAAAANGLTTLVYAAIGASLIAALAAIVALMQISRKIA
jgi:hypothetical protein